MNLNRRRSDESKFLVGIVGILAVWGVGVLLSLTLTGTIIWGIIKLVSHFTA